MSKRSKQSSRQALRMLALITQLGINMLVSIFICVIVGRYVAQKTGMDLLFPLFLVLGILAGFRSCYVMICRFVNFGKKEESEHHELDKMDSGGK